MAETAHPYHGQSGKISIKKGSTVLELGIVQNWKANVEFEAEELYGLGSVFRQAVARHSGKVTVNCEFCAIPDTISGTMIGYIMDPAGGTGELKDTTSLAEFEFEGQFTSADGNHKLKITVGGVYFANFPWEASPNEWIKCNLEGTGNSYKIETVTSDEEYA